MQRHTVLLLMLAAIGLIAARAAAQPFSATNLADDIKAHINERMYDTCKTVVLEKKTDNIYRGYVEFLNGIKVDLEVTTTDNRVEYRFLKRPQPPAGTTPGSLNEWQMTLARKDAEIARLRALCRQAGIDPNAEPAPTTAPQVRDANDLPASSPQDAPPIVHDDQQAPPDNDPVFTWQLYHKIQKGMSYPRVAQLLGHEGHLLSTADFDGAVNDVFVWTNPDDSHICVVFRNGNVLVRTQHDLPDTDPPPQP